MECRKLVLMKLFAGRRNRETDIEGTDLWTQREGKG